MAYLNPIIPRMKRAIADACRQEWQKLGEKVARNYKARLQRRRADIDPDLIRNAEIRALTDPS